MKRQNARMNRNEATKMNGNIFVASCPLMSALCGFTSFHFGLLWLHLLSGRLCVTLSSFIFVFCALICFHFGFVVASFLFTFGLLWFHFLPFWPFAAHLLLFHLIDTLDRHRQPISTKAPVLAHPGASH